MKMFVFIVTRLVRRENVFQDFFLNLVGLLLAVVILMCCLLTLGLIEKVISL